MPNEWNGMEWNGLTDRTEDLNLRPSGYEPDELPDCSTPRQDRIHTGFAAGAVQQISTWLNRLGLAALANPNMFCRS